MRFVHSRVVLGLFTLTAMVDAIGKLSPAVSIGPEYFQLYLPFWPVVIALLSVGGGTEYPLRGRLRREIPTDRAETDR